MTTVGVYAMSITPFTAAGDVDEGLLRAHLRYVSAPGIGVYLCSQGSGEGDLLSFDEKVAVYRAGVSELGGRVPVYAAGIGLAGATARICALAREAERAGVDAVQVLGPRPGPVRMREDEIETYFRTVVESVTCAVHLSHNVPLTGYGLPMAVVARLLADYPHITVVNVSEIAATSLAATVARLVDAFGDRIEVRVGITAQVAAVHTLGARGLLCFDANVAPGLTAAVWHALDAADGPALARTLPQLLRCNLALSKAGNPRSLKAALEILGRDGGTLRAPYLPLTPDERAELERDLLALDLTARRSSNPEAADP